MTDEYIEVYKSIPNPANSRYSDTAIFEEDGVVFRNTYAKTRQDEESDDKIIRVRAEEEGRLDLIAERFYGDPKLYWLIGEANKIINPISEVVGGMEMRVPNIRNKTA